MDVFERTFVAGTRREDAADGGGRRAEPPGRGGAGMLLKVGGFSLGGLDERVGGAMFGATSLAFSEGSRVCSGACISMRLPLLGCGATCSCGFGKAGTRPSMGGSSNAKVGLSSWDLSLYKSS
jgi:hypothetical protein